MRFCDNCENMYYIRINADEPNKLVYYCRNCGNEDTTLEVDNVCVSKTVLKNKDVAAYSTVNKYTKLDPTLPRVTNVLCPNEGCSKRSEKGINKQSEKQEKDKEIICIRSDDINMKYMYLCAECDTTWST
jgi:DNA-directed RNA polymerase subunit M/transcription elongation factor TFIIS